MTFGIIVGAVVAGLGIGFCVGMLIIAKGCEVLNERIEKGD